MMRSGTKMGDGRTWHGTVCCVVGGMAGGVLMGDEWVEPEKWSGCGEI